MLNDFDKLADSVGKAIETVPEVYDDGLKLATQESGKVLAIIPQTIKSVLLPLRKWNIEREYNFKETEKLLAQKLENVSPEKIVTPKPYVAIPTIQAISYSMDSEELRNLYSNLLAKSMITDSRDSVHPSFVEIIKQMSPMDASIFDSIFKSNVRPLINLQKNGSSGGMQPIQYHCSWIKTFSIKQVATSIDNLIRLGLIEIPYGESYATKSVYDMVKQNPLFKLLEQQSDGKLTYEEQYIKINDLSTLFYNICVLNP
ncbi:DUF4393 domain-containing protein [Enterocloster citroniae]|uniref:DUF4393 domain-containing protein n=1 Tax=Enterocloster citroniae TaxID=358743 RepID=UPI0034A59F47